MRCLVTSFGSAGDFLPTLALAAALKRRGHDVRFVANPFYEGRTRSAGLELIPAGEHCDLHALFERNPAYGDPANARMLFTDLVVPNSVATYRVITDLLRSDAFDVVIGNDAGFAAIWAAKEHRVPSVVVHASPLIWMSWRAPAVLGDPALFNWLARPVSPQWTTTAAARGKQSLWWSAT